MKENDKPDALKNPVFTFRGFYLLVAVPLAAWFAGGVTATLMLCGIITLAVLERWTDIVEVAIGPLKAKLEKQVAEAVTTSAQLRSVGAALGETALAVLAGEGRGGGMGYAAKFVLKERLEAELKKLGLDENQLQLARRTWHAYMLHDHSWRIWRKLPDVLRKTHPEISTLMEAYPPNQRADAWRRTLTGLNLLTPELAEALKDLEYFVQTGLLRRPEEWGDGTEPVTLATPIVP